MRIRIKRTNTHPLERITMFLSLLCISSFALLEHVSIAIPAFSSMKFPLLYVGGICLLFRIDLFFNHFKRKRYFYILSVLVILCAVLGMGAYANRNPVFGTNPMRATVRLILFWVELFLLFLYVSEEGKFQYVLNFLFWYVLLLVVITDLLFFSGAVVFRSGRHENYLIGTKFSVSYAHMNLITLWYMRNNLQSFREKKTKRVVLLLLPFMLAVSIRVDCATGVLGCFALLGFFMMINTRFQRQFLRFRSPVFLGIFLAGSVVFPFVAERIISIPIVTQFIENVMGRDAGLTGRLEIFGAFISKMQGYWLWGFGYGNGNAAAKELFRCANAQNALLQWVLQVGLIASLLIVLMLLMIFRQLSRSPRQRFILPMVMLVYVYIVLGTVETTFSMSFFLWLAVIMMYVNERPKEYS